MKRATWVKLVFYVFVLTISVGVYLEFGLGWALMVLGTLGASSALFLAETDDKEGPK